MTRGTLALVLAGTAIGALAALPAHAQTTPTAADVLARACMGRAGQPIDRADIAEALLIEAHISPAEIVGTLTVQPSNAGQPLTELYNSALVTAVHGIIVASAQSPRRTALAPTVRSLEDLLNRAPRSVTVEKPDGQRDSSCSGRTNRPGASPANRLNRAGRRNRIPNRCIASPCARPRKNCGSPATIGSAPTRLRWASSAPAQFSKMGPTRRKPISLSTVLLAFG